MYICMHIWNFAFAHTYLSFLPFSVASEAPDEEGTAAPTQAEAEARRLEFHSLDFSSILFFRFQRPFCREKDGLDLGI
jgi:hypothetical protein